MLKWRYRAALESEERMRLFSQGVWALRERSIGHIKPQSSDSIPETGGWNGDCIAQMFISKFSVVTPQVSSMCGLRPPLLFCVGLGQFCCVTGKGAQPAH
jgi:hypothetical protein